MAPYVIFALPRSRTFWLSRLLTQGGAVCGHEELRYVRSLADVQAWLTLPATGSAETAAAPFWRTLRALAPDTRVVVIRRDPVDVLASMHRLPVHYDPASLAAVIAGLDRKLDQIAARWPDALSIDYHALDGYEACNAVFSHCLGRRLDPAWWSAFALLNLQCDVPALMRYHAAYAGQLAKVAAVVKHRTIANLMQRRPPVAMPDLTIQQEAFREFYADAKPLFAEHLVQTGQAPDDHQRKNLPVLALLDDIGCLQVMTARTRNGLMAGYLMTVIGPSLDAPDRKQAEHTIFFAAPDYRGLGMKLQRAALEALRARGVDEVLMRAGVRGSGPKLGTIYKRLGAADFGQLFRLDLTEH